MPPKKKCTNQGKGRPRKIPRGKSSGRKSVIIDNASKKTKYRRAWNIINDSDNDNEVVELAVRLSKKKSVANEDCTNEEDTVDINVNSRHTPVSGLAFFLEGNYTKERYNLLVKDSHARGVNIYPAYSIIAKAKKECEPNNYLPLEESKKEVEVYVPLQDMLNKTAERLCEAVAIEWEQRFLSNLELSVTAGFDSSSGHLNPHQSYRNEDNINKSSTQSLLVSSFIIIKLENSLEKEVNWVNPVPQSTSSCRPLRLALEKEDDDTILKEFTRISEEIQNIEGHHFFMSNNKRVDIKYVITQTMFDGKCINCIVGNNATTRCPICLKTSHQFGNLNDPFTPKDANLEFGLGLLHDEIKCFEYFLHLSYRLKERVWDRTKEVKDSIENRKKTILENLYKTFNVRADQVIQGFGTTNTGNLARTCFAKPQLFAETLEIDEVLVKNVAWILLAFKCKKQLDLEKLEKFCWTTYCRNYTLYPWSRLSPTVHKLLKHGCEIARKFPMPMAYYSEDANESWHKLYRKNMKERARQNSRENRLMDTFNRAVHITDPLVRNMYIGERIKERNRHPIPLEIKEFILQSQQIEVESEKDDDE